MVHFSLWSQSTQDTLTGRLDFHFFGYPTLYQLDSNSKCSLIQVLEKHSWLKKDDGFRIYRKVYKELKQVGKEEYPCVLLSMATGFATLYLPVELYHPIIEKSSTQLEQDEEIVSITFVGVEIYPKYYILEKLINVEFVKEPQIRYSHKFAVEEYKR